MSLQLCPFLHHIPGNHVSFTVFAVETPYKASQQGRALRCRGPDLLPEPRSEVKGESPGAELAF